MDSTALNHVELETQFDFDWTNLEEQLLGTLQFEEADWDSSEKYMGMTNFNEFGPSFVQQQNKHTTYYNQFTNFEDTSNGTFGLWDASYYEDSVFNAKPPMSNNLTMEGLSHFDDVTSVSIAIMQQGNIGVQTSSYTENEEKRKRNVRANSKSAALELDDIQKYFYVPITKAAQELKVGLTILKKRCRELNIMRWPHRKIKSLKSLIDNVKELGLTNEIEMLEEHKRMLEKLPEMELTERTKKLRQACFKANYKRRRSLSALAL